MSIQFPKRQPGDFSQNAMMVRIIDQSGTHATLRGWGNNTTGVLANGIMQNSNIPVQDVIFDPNTTLPAAGSTIVDMAFTNANLYVVYSNGWVYSAGRNDYGQLGHGDTVSRPYLKRIDYFVTNGYSITKVWAAGASSATSGGGCVYFLATGAPNQLYACGANAAGNLGNASTPTSNISTPAPCAGLSGTVTDVQVSANNGNFSAYVLNSSGQVFVAGHNSSGQLGVGNTTNVTGAFTSATVTGGGSLTNVASISVTSTFALVLNSSGVVWTTGSNTQGQLGLGDTTDRNRFTQVTALSNVSKAEVGGASTGYCYALTSSGVLYTWGNNGQNNLFKNNATSPVTTPSTTVFTAGQIVKVFFPKSDTLSTNTQLFAQTSDNKLIYAGSDNGQQGIANTAIPGAYKVIFTPQFDSISDVFAHGAGGNQRLFVLGTATGSGLENVYACGNNADAVCTGAFASSSNPSFVDCFMVPLVSGLEA